MNTEQEKSWLGGAVKDVALTGLAAIFLTEDSIRNYLKELKLPKDLSSLLLDSIMKKKDDLYGLLAKELTQVLSQINVTDEIGNFLRNHKIKLEAKIVFEKKEKE